MTRWIPDIVKALQDAAVDHATPHMEGPRVRGDELAQLLREAAKEIILLRERVRGAKDIKLDERYFRRKK